MNIKSSDTMVFGGNLLVAKPYMKQGYEWSFSTLLKLLLARVTFG